jgi:ADP-heptose:LPS heptosyltransferase
VKRILIIQTAFLGDVILATPVISELKRLFPESAIDIVVKKGNECLLLNNPHLRSAIIFDKTSGKWKSIIRLTKQFREEKYDLVVNLHRHGSSGIMTAFSKGKKKYGFKKNPFSILFSKRFNHVIGDGTHEVERNLSLIKEFGAEKLVRPELFPSEKDQLKVDGYIMERYYCIAPASVWFTKQLPAAKWIELIRGIDENTPIYLVGGLEDVTLCEEIKEIAKHPLVVNLAGKISILQSAALMKRSTRSYVNDSGPLHLASSVNANVTAFFCSTVPAFGFGPLSDNSEVLEVKDLDCRPCGIHGHDKCPKGHFSCAKIDLSSLTTL